MVKSMTGFGKSTLSKEKREYQMEIKSVNQRNIIKNKKRKSRCIYNI